jgi:hypothetical protein
MNGVVDDAVVARAMPFAGGFGAASWPSVPGALNGT